MNRRHSRRSCFLIAAALVVETLALPSSVGAVVAAQAIIARSPTSDPTVDLLIGARPGRGAGVAALTAHFGTRDKGIVRGLPVRRLRVPAAVAAALERTLETDPSVRYVEVDATAVAALEPNDPFYADGTEWGLPLIGAPAAWDTATGASGPIIAVIDTGVDAAHPDLVGRVLPGIDFVNGDTDPSDDNGHGTHVAGIAAASGNNAIGGAGVCWGCLILPVKALDASGAGTYSNLASGITWASDNGAKVINLSLGAYSDSTTLAAAVSYAQGRGIVVVAAAGNDSLTSRFYPAAFEGVVAVGAAGPDGHLREFSNYGTDWVDVAAGACSTSTWPGGGYSYECGTSMATPFVSGSLGVLLAADPAGTPGQALLALDTTAGPPSTEGTEHGLIHLDAALATLLSEALPVPTPAATPTPTTVPVIVPPLVVTRSASLARVPKALAVLTRAGSGRITLANPRHAYLVLTLKRGRSIVWRRTTRSAAIHWSVNLAKAAYTLTVTRPGARVARGTISLRYHRR